MNEGDLTAEVSKRVGRTGVSGRARRVSFDDVATVMEPSCGKTASIPDGSLILFTKALVGAASLSRNYSDSASVCSSILGPLATNFSSWDNVHGSLSAARSQRGAGPASGRVSDPVDYTCVEEEIGYEFRDKLLLEDALSQSKSRGTTATQQGLESQRLELLGTQIDEVTKGFRVTLTYDLLYLDVPEPTPYRDALYKALEKSLMKLYVKHDIDPALAADEGPRFVIGIPLTSKYLSFNRQHIRISDENHSILKGMDLKMLTILHDLGYTTDIKAVYRVEVNNLPDDEYWYEQLSAFDGVGDVYEEDEIMTEDCYTDVYVISD
ncbi:hypothetical protein BGX20_005942, partial [Mortierella sp. AD010]